MAETTDPQTPDVPEAPAASGAQGGGQTPDAGREPAAPTLTREQEDAIAAKARRDADARAKAAEKRAAEAEAERDALRAAEAERKAAEMTEVERAAQAKADAEARAQAAEERAQRATTDALRATMIADHAADLPAPFKQSIGGATQDELQESIERARGEYDTLRVALTQETVATIRADLRNLTDEQLAEKYGDDGKDLIALRAGRPVNIGNPSNAGGSAPPAPAQTNMSQDLRQVHDQRGQLPEAVRKRNWVQAITGK